MTESISSTGPAAHQHERERGGERRRKRREAGATGTRGGFKPELGETGGGRGGRDGMGDLPY